MEHKNKISSSKAFFSFRFKETSHLTQLSYYQRVYSLQCQTQASSIVLVFKQQQLVLYSIQALISWTDKISARKGVSLVHPQQYKTIGVLLVCTGLDNAASRYFGKHVTKWLWLWALELLSCCVHDAASLSFCASFPWQGEKSPSSKN